MVEQLPLKVPYYTLHRLGLVAVKGIGTLNEIAQRAVAIADAPEGGQKVYQVTDLRNLWLTSSPP
jgi:hypothetical protein